jgi:hypothetical protein
MSALETMLAAVVGAMIATSAAFAGSLILGISPVHADTADNAYLAALSSHGISGPADLLIADGHRACDAVSQSGNGIGMSPRQIAIMGLSNDLAAQGYLPHDKGQLMLDAFRAYCPQFAPPQ